jgi:hypothetical protein
LLGFSSILKCTRVIQMLADHAPTDQIDKYLDMGESTCLDAMCRGHESRVDPWWLKLGRPLVEGYQAKDSGAR